MKLKICVTVVATINAPGYLPKDNEREINERDPFQGIYIYLSNFGHRNTTMLDSYILIEKKFHHLRKS